MDSENPRASIISAYLIINSQIVCYNVSSTIGCELLIDTKKRDLQSLPKKLKESIPSKKIVALYKKCQKKFKVTSEGKKIFFESEVKRNAFLYYGDGR